MCSSSESVSGWVSDCPGCRLHLQAAGEKRQDRAIWRCHCGEKVREMLTLRSSKEEKRDERKREREREDISYLDTLFSFQEAAIRRKWGELFTFYLHSVKSSVEFQHS